MREVVECAGLLTFDGSYRFARDELASMCEMCKGEKNIQQSRWEALLLRANIVQDSMEDEAWTYAWLGSRWNGGPPELVRYGYEAGSWRAAVGARRCVKGCENKDGNTRVFTGGDGLSWQKGQLCYGR